MIDVNDGEPQRGGDVIPAGTKVRAIGIIRPGGSNRYGHEAVDGGWLTASNTSDFQYLSWEFTVVDGPFAKRKFWQNMGVAGGEVNEKGESKSWNITKSTLRAMLNSARNVKPDDSSPDAIAARRFHNWGELNGIEFCCKLRVEKGKDNYPDKNAIGNVIEPGAKDYAELMGNGGGFTPVGAPTPTAAPAPAWGGGQTNPAPAARPPVANSAVPAWAR